jgi:hypothetical protein
MGFTSYIGMLIPTLDQVWTLFDGYPEQGQG